MIKKILCLSFLSFFPLFLLAQDVNTVSGQITDGETNNPFPGATIVVYAGPDSTLVTGTVSDQDGRFSIKGLEEGEYNLQISFVGYRTETISLLIGELNTFYDIGKVELNPRSSELDEIYVEGEREMVSSELDRKSFNIDENIAQAGGSILDALRTMPGVTVDQEGKVILRGSDKVAVLIDGNQSSLTGYGNQKALDNISVSNIERIEIINNPSARYGAGGMAGIINIIYTEETEQGLNGEAGISAGLGAFTKPQRRDLPTNLGSYSDNPKLNPSVNLNYRTPNINYFLQSQVIFQEDLPNNEFTIRDYSDGRQTISQVAENRRQTHYILNGGADWYLNSKNTITFSGVYDFETHTDTSQVPFINQNINDRYRFYAWNEEEDTGFLNFSSNYEHQFDQPGHTLEANLQYTRGWEDETYSLNDSSAVRVGKDKTNILAIEHTSLLKADYVKPLKSGRFETGTNIRLRRIPVEYTVNRGVNSIIYNGLGDESKWNENLYAMYINYVWQVHYFDIEAGIRAENTDVSYKISDENIYYPENDSYDDFSLFPNLRLTYKFNLSNQISAFYNRRVDRPGEAELRIFPKYDDPELLKVGNPYLRPQFTQNVELAYKHLWETGSVFLAGFHRIIDDPYMRIFAVDATSMNYDIINKIYQNTGGATNTGIEVILNQNVQDFAELSGSFNLYRNHIDEYTGTLLFPTERPFTIEESDDRTWDFKVNGSFYLPKNFQLQLTGIYYAPKNIPQGRQLARSSVDIGIKKTMFNEQAEINLSISDIFGQFGIQQDITEEEFEARYENNYETQVGRIEFKYKF